MVFFGGRPGCFHLGGVKWRFVETRRGRPRVHGERVKSAASLSASTVASLDAWCRRREVSRSAAIERALATYCPAAAAPAERAAEATVKVQFRLTAELRDQVVADAARWGCGYSRYVDAAVTAMCARTHESGLEDFFR